MNADANELTAPILDPAQVAALRRDPVPRAAPAAGPWLALVVAGNLIVLTMIVLVLLWS